VVERWDSFTIPVFITIGIYWDAVLCRREGHLRRWGGAPLSAVLGCYFAMLIGCNIWSTHQLLGITNNSIPYRPSAHRWPYETLFYFYFDHRGFYDLSKKLDAYFDDRTFFLSSRYMQGPQSHVYGILDQYLTLYSRNYRERLIEDSRLIGPLVAQGKLGKLLYLDTVRIPWYVDTAKSLFLFDPAATATVYRNSQLVLNRATFSQPR
jgi:hypothetical protein